MAVVIRGKELSQSIIENIKNEIEANAYKPGIAVIIVGNNPASRVYVKKKNETALQAGMNSKVVELDENISQIELENVIENLNNDSSINAILVQLPLPKHLNAYKIIEKILPEKDVDGFHPLNAGKLAVGLKPYAIPCTPLGVIRLLDENNIHIEGKNVVIIGRSNIVGKPLANLFLNRNATVTICHSKTQNLPQITSQADILAAAAGIPKLVKADWVKPGAVIIDVGINRTEEGKLVGDVDFDNVEPLAGFITPVPGGVGPMTIAMLLQNTLNLYKLSLNSDNFHNF